MLHEQLKKTRRHGWNRDSVSSGSITSNWIVMDRSYLLITQYGALLANVLCSLSVSVLLKHMQNIFAVVDIILFPGSCFFFLPLPFLASHFMRVSPDTAREFQPSYQDNILLVSANYMCTCHIDMSTKCVTSPSRYILYPDFNVVRWRGWGES